MKIKTTTEEIYFVKMLTQRNADNFAPLLFTSSLRVAAEIAKDTSGLIISKTIFLN